MKYKEQAASKKEVKQVMPEAVKFKYLYQEQERQDELGLNWDSFKYRNYDYAIGRFMSVDPLAEKYPYNATYAFQENKMGLGRELEGLELEYRDNNGIVHAGPFDQDNVPDNWQQVETTADGWSESLPAVEITAHNNQDTDMTQINQENSHQNDNLPVNINLSLEQENSNYKIFDSGFGDKIALNYSSGIFYNYKNNISPTSMNFGYNYKKELSSVGVSVGSSNFNLTSGIDLKNYGFSSKLTLFGANMSNSVSVNNGFGTSFGYSNDNKYTNFGMYYKPGKVTGLIVVAVITKNTSVIKRLMPLLKQIPLKRIPAYK